MSGSGGRHGVVGVFRRDSRFLVIRRSDLVSAPGRFCFPGGGVEPGESEPEALVRELEEELGIPRAEPIRCVWKSRTPGRLTLSWWTFWMPDEQKLIPNPREVAAVHWWTIRQMAECGLLLPSNEEFLSRLLKKKIRM